MTRRRNDRRRSAGELVARSSRKVFGVKTLVVVRESQTKRLPLELMLRLTVRRVANEPWAETALENGLQPLDRPDEFGGHRLVHPGTTGVVYSLDGAVILIYGGSAAMANRAQGDVGIGESENAFGQVLADVVTAYRPERIVVHETSRLTRSAAAINPAMRAMTRVGCRLEVGRAVFLLNTSEGRQALRAAVHDAESERDRGQERLVSGVLEHASLCRWVMAEAQMPPGYVLGPEREVLVDVGSRDVIRAIVRLLGMGLSAKEFVQSLADLGVASAGWVARHGHKAGSIEAPSIAQVRNPYQVLKRYQGYLELWQTGYYTFYRRNTLAFADNLAGFDVYVGDGDDDPGLFVEVLNFGVPEGGWASSEEFELAFAEVDRAKWGGNRRSTSEYVFSSVPPWRTGEREMGLVRKGELLKVWESTSQADPPSCLGEDDDEVQLERRTVCVIDGRDLVESLARAAYDRICEGGEVRWFDGVAAARGFGLAHGAGARSKADVIRAQLLTLEKQAQDHLKFAQLHADDSELSEFALEQVRATVARKCALERELDALESGTASNDDYLRLTEAEALIRGLAVLRSCHGPLPRRVAAHIRRLIADFSVSYSSDGWATWTAVLMVPVAGGTRLLGPLSARIRTVGLKSGTDGVLRQAGMLTSLESERVRLFLVDGQDPEDIAAAHDVNTSRMVSALTRSLSKIPTLNRSLVPALLGGAPSDVRKAVAATLGFVERDELWPEQWCRLIEDTYLGDQNFWGPRGWRPRDEYRQELNDYLASVGGMATIADAAAAIGRSTHHVYRAARTLGKFPPTTVLLEARGRFEASRVSLGLCVHCGAMLRRVVRVPELALLGTALVCDACRTADSRRRVDLPSFYFEDPIQTSASNDLNGDERRR